MSTPQCCESSLPVSLPATVLAQTPTLRALGEHLEGSLGGEAARHETSVNGFPGFLRAGVIWADRHCHAWAGVELGVVDVNRHLLDFTVLVRVHFGARCLRLRVRPPRCGTRDCNRATASPSWHNPEAPLGAKQADVNAHPLANALC